MPGRCYRCHRTIAFVRMRDGGTVMPVDPTPDLAGNVVAMRAGGAGWIDGTVRPNRDVGTRPPRGYSALVPHWATCPKQPAKKTTVPAGPTLFDAVPPPEPPAPF